MNSIALLSDNNKAMISVKIRGFVETIGVGFADNEAHY